MYGASMKIKQLNVSHLFGIKKANFDFTNSRLISIVGPNGSGKSSIMDSLFFALMGHSTDSRNVKAEDYIRRGADIGSVELIFEDINGITRRVRRKLSNKTKSNGINHQVELATLDPFTNQWKNESDMISEVSYKVASILMKGKIEDASQTELKALVKQAETALSIAAFISQGNVSKILSVTTSERMQLITSAFNISDSDKIKQAAKELKKIADKEHTVLEAERKAAQDQLDSFGKDKAGMVSEKAGLEVQVQKYREFKDKYYEIYVALTNYIRLSEEHNKAAEKLNASTKLYNAAKNYEAAKASSNAHREFISAATSLRNTIGEVLSLRRQLAELALKEAPLKAAYTSADKAKQDITKEFDEAEKAASAAKDFRRRNDLEKNICESKKEKDSAETQLDKNLAAIKSKKSEEQGLKHAIAVKEYSLAVEKLEKALLLESLKTKAEQEYLAAEKTASVFPKLKEQTEVETQLSKLNGDKETLEKKLNDSKAKLETFRKDIKEKAETAIKKDYASAVEEHDKASSELKEIEQKLVQTLVRLLYEFSEDGIINLKDISLDSDKAAKWALSFEHSEFKALVQTSGRLKSVISSAQSKIKKMEMENPFLKEGHETTSKLSADALREEARKLSLASAKLETEITSYNKSLDNIISEIAKSNKRLEEVSSEIAGIDLATVQEAEKNKPALKAAFDEANKKYIKANAEASGAERTKEQLEKEYSGIAEEKDADSRELSELNNIASNTRLDIVRLETSCSGLRKNIESLESKIKQAEIELANVIKNLPTDITEKDAVEAEKKRAVLRTKLDEANNKLYKAKEAMLNYRNEVAKTKSEIERKETDFANVREEAGRKSKDRLDAIKSYAESNGLTIPEAIHNAETAKAPAGYTSFEAVKDNYNKDYGSYQSAKQRHETQGNIVRELLNNYNQGLPEKLSEEEPKKSSSKAYEMYLRYDEKLQNGVGAVSAITERIEQYDKTEAFLKDKEAKLAKVEPLRKYTHTIAQMADGNNFTRFMADTAMSMLLGGVNAYLESIGISWRIASIDGNLFVQGEEGAARPVAGMSGGEQVLISVLLLKHISNFGCLWLDESLPNLDEKRLKETVDILTAENDTQLLLTTHDPDLARMFPETWIMEDGMVKVEQSGKLVTNITPPQEQDLETADIFDLS